MFIEHFTENTHPIYIKNINPPHETTSRPREAPSSAHQHIHPHSLRSSAHLFTTTRDYQSKNLKNPTTIRIICASVATFFHPTVPSVHLSPPFSRQNFTYMNCLRQLLPSPPTMPISLCFYVVQNITLISSPSAHTYALPTVVGTSAHPLPHHLL